MSLAMMWFMRPPFPADFFKLWGPNTSQESTTQQPHREPDREPDREDPGQIHVGIAEGNLVDLGG